MADDEVAVLREALSTHRTVLLGALQTNDDLDIDRAFQIHAQMARLLAHWDEFSANEQREIVKTIGYLVDTDDERKDLTDRNGFADDLDQVHRLQAFLGYV